MLLKVCVLSVLTRGFWSWLLYRDYALHVLLLPTKPSRKPSFKILLERNPSDSSPSLASSNSDITSPITRTPPLSVQKIHSFRSTSKTTEQLHGRKEKKRNINMSTRRRSLFLSPHHFLLYCRGENGFVDSYTSSVSKAGLEHVTCPPRLKVKMT